VEHVGIDLGGRLSQICARSASGDIVDERKIPTTSIQAYLLERPASRVVLETCSEAFAVANQVLELGHEVRVVPSTLAPTLGVGARKTKSDVRDARVLSEVSCRIDLPSVHIPSEKSRSRKTMCGMREQLVACRTATANCVRGWLRTRCLRLPSGGVSTFAARVREMAQAKKLQLPTFVERMLETLDHLCTQIAAADRELTEEAKSDETCRRLMTVPGVGPVSSVRFVAALDTCTRFENAHKVASYLGLTPGENSSSERVRRTGITKAGATAVRRVLVNAAWVARRYAQGDPMVLWCHELEKRRGKFIAVTALARKLASIMFAIWRDGSTYTPLKITHAEVR